jgi:hypothetical protein
MSTLADAMSPVIAALDAAGIRSCVSMRDIDPPTVFLPIPELTFRFKDASFDAAFRLVLIVPNTSRELAIESLSELLETVQVAIGRRAQTARPVEVVLADNSAVVLAYELSFATRNC